MSVKVPTFEDLKNYTGLHCHRLWAEVGNGYICPSCNRDKYQILRWTLRIPNSPNAFMDWVAVLHKHHDHSQGFTSTKYSRFPEAIICDQCNAADGAAKRKLGLPRDFSFSPNEISFFIKVAPHAKHEINFEKARVIYQAISMK
jgi:hypothetical protein